MPKYDYKCNICKANVEFERSLGEDREPSCCNEIMTRVWNSFGIVFNGPGFYSTDSRK